MSEEFDTFDEHCMDAIYSIVRRSERQSRKRAIRIAKRRLGMAKRRKREGAVEVYTRVVKEFQDATDEEYERLRAQTSEEYKN